MHHPRHENVAEATAAALLRRNYDVKVLRSAHSPDDNDSALDILMPGDALFIHGGDGTGKGAITSMRRVVHAKGIQPIPICAMPGGTANDFRRATHGNFQPPLYWLLDHGIVVDAHTILRTITYADSTEQHTAEAISYAGMGSTARIAEIIAAKKYKSISPLLSSLGAVLNVLARPSTYKLSERSNKAKPKEGEVVDLTVATGEVMAVLGRLATRHWEKGMNVIPTRPGMLPIIAAQLALLTGRPFGEIRDEYAINVHETTPSHLDGDFDRYIPAGATVLFRQSPDTYPLLISNPKAIRRFHATQQNQPLAA